MQWFVLGLFACFLNVQGGVLKCSPDDPASCARETDYPEEATYDEECSPGTEWESNCHSCRCSGAGKAECRRKDSCTSTFAQPTRCKPFVQFKKSCNTCICLEDGNILCSMKDCQNSGGPHFTVASAESSELETEYEYRHETNFEDTEDDAPYLKVFENNNVDENSNVDEEREANHVNAFDDVKDNDNQLYVRPKDHSIEEMEEKNIEIDRRDHKVLEEYHRIIKRSVCKPNQAFTTDCNACKCAADGQSYTCSHNECMDGPNKEVEVFMENEGVDHIESHTVCKPRGTFYIGCNTCHCNAHGNDYSCTNKPCPLPEDVELFHELRDTKSSKDKNLTQKIVCVANRMFIKDCNTCWCNEDGTGFFCTRRVCVNEFPDDDKPEELRIILKECRPDEVFELDCNMCRCNADGKSYSCTRRACVEPVDEDDKNSTLIRKTRGAQEPPAKTCEPGQEFRLDCNKCLCDDEGIDFACTRIDCTAPASADFSSPRNKRETSEQEKMECSPNSVFDRDCNVCRCTADGHYATCTTKRCSSPTNSSTTDDSVSKAPAGGNSDFRCNPGEQFKRGCNDCSCSADGKNVLCTVRFCDQDITVPSF